MRCRRPLKGIVLLPRRWARRNRRHTQAEWGIVLFTDEKRFILQGNDRRTRIYRERGECFQDNCIIERDSHGGGSVMVWAGVSLHHKTNIVFINGNLNAAHYQHEVLDMEVIPLLRNHRGMQLLHDGAPAQRARATTAYLNANNVNVVDFPPQITRLEHN